MYRSQMIQIPFAPNHHIEKKIIATTDIPIEENPIACQNYNSSKKDPSLIKLDAW